MEDNNNSNNENINNSTNVNAQKPEENPYYNPYFQNTDMGNSPYYNDNGSNVTIPTDNFYGDIYNQTYMDNVQQNTEPDTQNQAESPNSVEANANDEQVNANPANPDASQANVNVATPDAGQVITNSANPDASQTNVNVATSDTGQVITNPENMNINQDNSDSSVNLFDLSNNEQINPNVTTDTTASPNIEQPMANSSMHINPILSSGINNSNMEQPQTQSFNQYNTNNSSMYGFENNEDFKRNWMGLLYDKSQKKKFNFAAFFFGGLYYLYRKLYLFGFVFLLISCIIPIAIMYVMEPSITSFSKLLAPSIISIIVPLLINIGYAIAFYPLYNKYIDKQLEKIKNEVKSPEQLINIAKQKGGTSVPLVIVGILISGVISSLALISILIPAVSSFVDNITPTPDLNNTINNEVQEPTYDYYNFYGDYLLEYDSSKWSLDANNKLNYNHYTISYIQSIENLSSVGFDITQSQGRSSFFTYLYNLFSSQIDTVSTTLELGSSSFVYDNGIYYSYFDLVYMSSIERCYFVLIPEDDIFIEFILSNTDTVIPEEIHNEVVSYICSITTEQNQTSTDVPQIQDGNIVNGVDNGGTLPDSEMNNNVDNNIINSQANTSNALNAANTAPNNNGGLTITP